MAKAIEELMCMSAKGQEYVLSRFNDKYCSIELDSVVYMIPKAVNQLIKDLIQQNANEKIQGK
jgi:hypothetical protein